MSEKLKIIIDTDLGSDCDDAGAIALAHNLCNSGLGELIGTTHCASEITGAVALKAINQYFGKADIPVGRYNKSVFLEDGICKCYTESIANEYLENHPMPEFESAEITLRRLLAENRDVVIVAIGMQNNIANLLKTEEDEISPLNGIELVKQSVKAMYVMGGNFKDLTHAEYNINCAIDSAQFVSQNFPAPIIYCGFELGCEVLTGLPLENAEENSPIRKAYYIFDGITRKSGTPIRESWDPITVYCALRTDNKLFRRSEACSIGFDDEGRAVLKPNGKDFYMTAIASNDVIADEINKYML